MLRRLSDQEENSDDNWLQAYMAGEWLSPIRRAEFSFYWEFFPSSSFLTLDMRETAPKAYAEVSIKADD